jgi:hypothetical protein
MSGSIGANRIPRIAVESTLKTYVEKVLNKFPGFKSAKISGSYNTSIKPDHGDLDLVIHIEGDETDKKILKQKFASYLNSLSDDIIPPFIAGRHIGKKSAGTGDIVITQFPIEGYPDLTVQIDNMIVMSEQESDYRKSFLDLPAEKQGLLVGLAKAILLEEDPQEIFSRLGIINIPKLDDNQEFEFNLSNKGLTLRLVTLGENFKELGRNDIWNSFNWNDVLNLFKNFKLDGNWEELLSNIKSKLKNPRSNNRVKSVFKSLVVINAGEAGTPKGDNKLAAINKVNILLENLATGKIALYPGAFKPPHRGHFNIVQQLVDRSDISEIQIIVSTKDRGGVSVEQSLAIWQLYLNKLGPKAKLIPYNIPVKYVIDTIKENPSQEYVVVFGKEEGMRYGSLANEPNTEIYDGGTLDNLSATDLRDAIQSRNIKQVANFLPVGINTKQFFDAYTSTYNGSKEPVIESIHKQQFPLLKEFVGYCKEYLKLKSLPPLKISYKGIDAENIRSFGGYNPNTKIIQINIANRHQADIFRTLAHELCHYKQDIQSRLEPNSGQTGHPHENEANSHAAIIMRNFAHSNPEMFKTQ